MGFINKYNVTGYLLAFNDDVLDEVISLELFKFLIDSGYIEKLEDRYKIAAKELIENEYLIFRGTEIIVNKPKITSLN